MRTRLLIGGGVLVLVLLIAVLALVLTGDEEAPRSDDRPTTTTDTTSPPEAPEEPIATTTIVPSSSAPPEALADAEAVVDAAAPQLGLTTAQLECLTNQLATDTELRAEVGSDPQPGEAGFDALVVAGQRCIVLVDVAPTFIDTIAPSLETQPTEEQRQCLAVAYADLSDEDRQRFLTTGLDPEGPDAEAGRQLLDELLAGCDLSLAG